MKLNQIVCEYVEFKQSMGMRFHSEAVILKAFGKALGDIDIKDVEPDAVHNYIAGMGPITSFWHRKHEAIKGFYRYVMGQGHVVSSPLPPILPKRPNPFVAYIYTPEEFRQLLDATEIFERGKSQMNTVTFHTLLLLLFNSGLRLGEALSLTCEDVNFPERLLIIRDAKYYKNRLVPINPKVAEKLYDYSNNPFRSAYSKSKHAPFFVKRNGFALTHHCVERSFRKLCIEAGIYRKDGARYQPRLHDIRHTFAVNRLLDWYRKGSDVQRLLPHLSTYLGHVNVSATQRYLTMTPELLGEANRRFEIYALSGMSHV